MLIILSPAKTLDMSPAEANHSEPRLLEDTNQLARKLARLTKSELSELMSISDKLTDLNYERYKNFQESPIGKPALLAFKGDVYQDLDAADFNDREFEFANQQIRILSGLYGLLRPRDLMQPYRLEMGTGLSTRRGANLYDFWGDKITDLLNADLEAEGSGLLLNLASQEYFNSLRSDKIAGRILNIHFKEQRKGKYRIISFNAKKARGKMARLITLEGITTADPLKDLVVNGYRYDDSLSEENDWVYVLD